MTGNGSADEARRWLARRYTRRLRIIQGSSLVFAIVLGIVLRLSGAVTSYVDVLVSAVAVFTILFGIATLGMMLWVQHLLRRTARRIRKDGQRS